MNSPHIDWCTKFKCPMSHDYHSQGLNFACTLHYTFLDTAGLHIQWSCPWQGSKRTAPNFRCRPGRLQIQDCGCLVWRLSGYRGRHRSCRGGRRCPEGAPGCPHPPPPSGAPPASHARTNMYITGKIAAQGCHETVWPADKELVGLVNQAHQHTKVRRLSDSWLL